jgi:transcriptional regulator with XRE-family HTH domain
MNEFKEVTAENLRFIRGSKGINQTEIAEMLGIPINAVSKIEGGKRGLSEAEKALLDLYFFGKMPFDIVNQAQLKSVLEFTALQWRVITIMATKVGMTPSAWIADRIRDFLAFNEKAREIAAEHGNQDDTPPAHLQPVDKVAEDETPYRTNGGKA